MMFIIDIDTENGGMQMNNDFCVDFGDEPNGPALAHEVHSKLQYLVEFVEQKKVAFFGTLQHVNMPNADVFT